MVCPVQKHSKNYSAKATTEERVLTLKTIVRNLHFRLPRSTVEYYALLCTNSIVFFCLLVAILH